MEVTVVTLHTTQECADALKTASRRLKEQDNRATQDPIFIVYDKRRVYGFDTTYDDDNSHTIWIDPCNECIEADADEFKKLEEAWDSGFGIPPDMSDGWERTAWQEFNEFVTCAFTEAACQRYIDENRHNLKQPFIYAASLYRNPEMIQIRKFVKEFGNG